jgi:hypothetical protein
VNGEEQAGIEEECAVATASGYQGFPSARFYALALVVLAGFVLSVFVLSFMISAITWLPDVDLMLNPFLHHRSIITHSIMIPGLLALIFTRFMLARLVVGVVAASMSIHLFADVLSPTIGYGEVWIPPGTFQSLGDLSAVFVLLNAAASFALAIIMFPTRLRSDLATATLVAGTLYGTLNEKSASASAFIAVMLVVVTGFLAWRGKIPDTPQKIIARLRARRDQELSSNAEYAAADREMLSSMSPMRRARVRAGIAVTAAITAARWVVVHPGKVAASECAVAAIVGALYLLGSEGRGGEDSALSAVGNGIWVLHSSGGYIMTEGGKYVAGTMRGSPP